MPPVSAQPPSGISRRRSSPVKLPRRLRFRLRRFRDLITAAVQRQQRKDHAVDALPHRFVEVSQRQQQVESGSIGGVLPNSRKRKDHAGILRVFLPTQNAIDGYNVILDVFVIGVKVFLRCLEAGSCQSKHEPVSANRSARWLRYLRLQIPGRFFNRGFFLAAGRKRNEHRKQQKNCG